jgi:histone arginine demethylase JMJD6
MQLTDHIDRHAGLSRERYESEYLDPLQPVILTDAVSHWSALGKWSPQFFKQEYGSLEVEVDGERMILGDLIDRIDASTDENPAPYLRNQPLAEWPAELTADVSPMPDCTKPNWFESRLFPSGKDLASVEVYIGGRGAQFPVLHYDGLHTHAFLMQLYGDKEYIVFSPDQTELMYPAGGGNRSMVSDVIHPDLSKFPRFNEARGSRFELHPGETLFVPSGWWHTARILSPSVTVSVNGLNRPNSAAFRRDYAASFAQRGKILGLIVSTGLFAAQVTRVFEIT